MKRFSLITGNQRHTLRQINTVNQSLIRAIMHNRSIQDLLDILCQHLDCYCCCFDPTGKKFAETSSLSTDFDTDSVYRAIKAFFVQPDKQRDSYFQENNIFIFPCMVNNQMSAALCVVVFEQSLDVVIPLAQAIVSGISIKFWSKISSIRPDGDLSQLHWTISCSPINQITEMRQSGLSFSIFSPVNSFFCSSYPDLWKHK